MLPVLYVEDSADDAFFMQTAFSKAAIANPMVVLSDGQEAIDYLAGNGTYEDRQQHPLPCLILLDLNLPIKSGFEVLDWLRQTPALKQLKVVVVSASGQQTDIDLAWKMGITDYVIKPLVVSRLGDIIKERMARWLESPPHAP